MCLHVLGKPQGKVCATPELEILEPETPVLLSGALVLMPSLNLSPCIFISFSFKSSSLNYYGTERAISCRTILIVPVKGLWQSCLYYCCDCMCLSAPMCLGSWKAETELWSLILTEWLLNNYSSAHLPSSSSSFSSWLLCRKRKRIGKETSHMYIY